MTDKEAMKLALEALETLMIERGSIYEKAITALKERLAQPAQRTEQKKKKVWTFWDLSGGDIADAIEAKLKEKNT
jgi:hypothetical protein